MGLPAKRARSIGVLFQRMADIGTIHNKEQFRHESNEIYSFKRGQIRVPCFRVERFWYLTHGFFKKRDKWGASDLRRAESIMAQHLGLK